MSKKANRGQSEVRRFLFADYAVIEYVAHEQATYHWKEIKIFIQYSVRQHKGVSLKKALYYLVNSNARVLL